MSWHLQFFRRVGQEALQLSEADAFFHSEPHLVRTPAAGAPADQPVEFTYTDPLSGESFLFLFLPPEPEVEAADIDFPYEETRLHLLVQPLQSPELIQAAAECVVRLCAALRLCMGIAGREGMLPAEPRIPDLVASYAEYSRDINLTVQAAASQKRKFLIMAGGLLLLYVVVSVLSHAAR